MSLASIKNHTKEDNPKRLHVYRTHRNRTTHTKGYAHVNDKTVVDQQKIIQDWPTVVKDPLFKSEQSNALFYNAQKHQY